MGKINFILEKTELINGSNNMYGILFKILEQDMNHRIDCAFMSSQGIQVITRDYPYLSHDKIYLYSKNRKIPNIIKLNNDIVSTFKSNERSRDILYEQILISLKEWSQNE